MPILKSQVFGGNLIGIYLTANNSYVLYPPNLLSSSLEQYKKVFEIPFYPITINNSNLIGVYTASNKYGIVVPKIATEDEFDKLRGFLKDNSHIAFLNSIDNAFGNLILCNDKGAVISSLLKNNVREIEDALNVEVVVYDFASNRLPGSISLANNKGCLVHPLSTDEDVQYISSVLKVEETDVSTINRGIPYLRSGAIINDKSGVFGTLSTGPEMMRLSSVLRI